MKPANRAGQLSPRLLYGRSSCVLLGNGENTIVCILMDDFHAFLIDVGAGFSSVLSACFSVCKSVLMGMRRESVCVCGGGLCVVGGFVSGWM